MADAPDAPQPPTPAGGGSSRRTLTIGIVALLAFAGSVAAMLITRSHTPNPVDEVSAALVTQAETLSGPRPMTDLRHARCTRDENDETLFSCRPVVDNALAREAVVVRWEDEVLTKRLAGSSLTAPPRSGDEVAQALGADEQATLGRTVKYGCAFSSGFSPDGSPASGSPGGYICATAKPLEGETDVLQRYVEFASDGGVTRDYMLDIDG